MATPPRKRPRASRRKRSPRRRLFRRVLPVLLGGTLVATAAFLLWVDRQVEARFVERTRSFPSRVYAAPFTLTRGRSMEPERLESRLLGMGYRAVERDPVRPGEYRRRGSRWVLSLREAPAPGGTLPPRVIEMEAWWGKVRRIQDRATGAALEEISLEPEVLFTFYAERQEERRWIPLREIPVLLQKAVVAVEDRRFRSHHGIDLMGIGRAALVNLRAGETLQGGSTISQQLVKNLLGPGRRTLPRKMVEAAGAVTLELRRGKDEILEAYLNEAYLGQRGPVAISGVGEASRFYFDREVGELDLPRCALLAGIIRSPGRYNPWRDPAAARGRRDLVLRAMRGRGDIDEAALQNGLAASLGLRRQRPEPGRRPWLEDYLAREVLRAAPEAIPSRAGFAIFTTLSAEVQDAATAALRSGLGRLEERLGPRPGEPLEGAVVVLRPADGAVLGLVGGRDYGRSQFHRALDSRRPAGSTFKPFVYLAAFEGRQAGRAGGLTAASLLEDTPLTMRSGGRTWSPANYDGRFRETVTAREALEHSINVPTVRAALQVGLPAVVEAAHRCGIRSELDPVPALALGTEEVTPLELAAGYAPFANGGWRVSPHGLLGVRGPDGTVLRGGAAATVRAISPQAAFLLSDLLHGALARGTGRTAGAMGFWGYGAGKTGTSDDLRDAWFVGYSGGLLALVWVGYDDNRPVGLPGAAAALPIWVDLMVRLGAVGDDPPPAPRGLVQEEIDPTTGGLATRGCPEVRRELFLDGTAPQEACQAHGGDGRRGFWWRLFHGRGRDS